MVSSYYSMTNLSWESRLSLPNRVPSAVRRIAWLPMPGRSFIGSYVLGMGFVLEPDEARRLDRQESRNKDVLFPYLNGEDLNSRPDQSPSRWVINFFDWPLDRDSAPEDYDGPVAADYPDCLAIVEEKVKPEINSTRRTTRRRDCVRSGGSYAERARSSTGPSPGMERVLVSARNSNIYSISGFGTVCFFDAQQS